jgi:hypothetical protein
MSADKLKLPKVSDSLNRPLAYMTDVVTYAAMLVSRAGLDPEKANLAIFDRRSEWKYQFPRGVQIGAADMALNKFEITIVVAGQDAVRANLSYSERQGNPMPAQELRDKITGALKGQRFIFDKSDLKAFKRGERPRSWGEAPPLPVNGKSGGKNGAHQNGGVYAVTTTFGSDTQTSISTPASRATAVMLPVGVVQPATTLPPTEANVPEQVSMAIADEGIVSLKNPAILQAIVLEFAACDQMVKGELLSSEDVRGILARAIKRAVTGGELRGLTAGLLLRKYLEKVGVNPARYQLTELITEHAELGDMLGKPVEAPKAPGVRGPKPKARSSVDPYEAKLNELRAAVAEKQAAAQKAMKLQSERDATVAALTKQAEFPDEIRKLSQRIGELQAELRRAQTELEDVQVQQLLATRSADTLPQLDAELEKAKRESEGLAEIQSRLSGAEAAYATLRSSLG